MPTTGCTSRLASSSLAARSVSSWWARCIGLRVWKATILRPAALGEFFAELGRRVAERFVVVVQRQLQALDLAADVDRLALVHQVVDGRVRRCRWCRRRASASLSRSGSQMSSTLMTASITPSASRRATVVARLELLGEFLGDVERDRHRPERAVGEAHLVADRFVVGLAHEAGQRREAAVAEQLEVAELARREIPGGPIARLGFDFGGAARRRRCRSTNVPPCGAFKWLVTEELTLVLGETCG